MCLMRANLVNVCKKDNVPSGKKIQLKVWFRSAFMSVVSWGKWHPLFPSHVDPSSTSMWHGPTQSYLDGISGPKVHKQKIKMQPPSYVPAKTSPTTASIKSFSTDSSYKVSVSLTVASVQNLVPTNSKIKPNIYKRDFPPPVPHSLV